KLRVSLSSASWASQNPASAVESAVLSGNRHGAPARDALRTAHATATSLAKWLLITGASGNFDRETPARCVLLFRSARLQSSLPARSTEMQLEYYAARVFSRPPE